MSLRQLMHCGSVMPIFGTARFSFIMPLLDYACIGLFLFVRTFTRSSSTAFVVNYVRLGVLLLPRAVGRMGSATFPITCARSDVLLSAFDFTQFGFSTSSRSFARPDSLLPAYGLSKLDFLSLVLDFAPWMHQLFEHFRILIALMNHEIV